MGLGAETPFVDEAVLHAGEEEARFVGDLDSFGSHLHANGRDALPAAWAQFVLADGLLCKLRIGSAEEAAEFGTNLVPTAPEGAHVGAFIDAFRPYLERRADRTGRRDAEARYRDFMWLRWRDGSQGSRAIEPYIAASQSVDMDDAEQAFAAERMMLRAVQLATQLRQHMDATRAAVDSLIRDLCQRDLTLGVLELAEAGARILSLDPDATRQLREDLAARVGASPSFPGKEQLLRTCVILARTLGDAEGANEHLRAIGALNEHEAEANRGLGRQHWLREALRAYGEAGDGASLQRLRPAYEEAGAEISDEDLATITGTVTISLDDIRDAADAASLGREVSVLSFLRLPFEIGLWKPWEEVHRSRQAEDARSFTSLFSHAQLEADGRVQPEPDRDESPEDFVRSRDISWASKNAIMSAGLSELLLEEFRKRGAWTAPNLTAVLANIDEALADAARPGLIRYEAGDPWSALHILAPQVERAVRVLAKEVEARVTSYTPHEGTRWVSMTQLMEDPAVRAALGEDLAKNIEAVFLEPYGQNIRNNVAHGAFSYPGNATNAATLCVLTLLSLGAVVIQERARKGPA